MPIALGLLAGSGQVSYSHMEDDFVDVKGQEYAKRPLLIAAAGRQNVLILLSIRPRADAWRQRLARRRRDIAHHLSMFEK